MEKESYLEPIYDRHVSFYKKAVVTIDEHGDKRLYSYKTLIAEIINGKLILHDGCYSFTRWMWGMEMDDYGESYFDSQTTRRHLNEFLQQNNFSWMSKSEMKKYYANQEIEKCTV